MFKFLLFILLQIPLISVADITSKVNIIEIHIAQNEINGVTTFLSLQQAIDHSYELSSSNISTVKFLIHGGTYNKQAAILRPKQGVHYEFTSEPSNLRLPMFDGNGEQLTWLRVLSKDGYGSNVIIGNLHIRNYLTAISIEGNRENQREFNAHNKIYNMRFENIGQTSPDSPPSTAVIRFVNSRQNDVSGNEFINIKNVQSCGLLHAVYLAHHSSENLIKRNTFTNLCGSPIRIRDDSNYNKIQLNKFRNIQTIEAMDEWFCDKNIRHDCTKSEPELRSHLNTFNKNHIEP
ncbi:hypothetical protein [Pseudomonas laurylsulfativorans]|uniref:hypothetical protein n=1 Tax=Pseudomonas laurylsulfativorans TaxID=1943631 RepID=UPI0010570069|nr:hypothetical protein [Pseudomonas laurylsulfativorans]